MSEEWVEVEISVTNQANETATRHVEYRAPGGSPAGVAREIVEHAYKAVGPERLHDAHAED